MSTFTCPSHGVQPVEPSHEFTDVFSNRQRQTRLGCGCWLMEDLTARARGRRRA